MIGFREAVKAANDYVTGLYPPKELRGLRVEEIVPSDDQKFWFVTLGWVAPDTRTVSSSSFGWPRPDVVEAPRVYKKLKINAESGEVMSMVIRD